MAFDWNQAEQGGNAERVPAGVTHLTITRLSYKPKPARDGSPKMMIIFSDDDERETYLVVSLSEKAAWVLARLMSRFGVDLDKLANQRVEPTHFVNPSLAEAWLLGLNGCCIVSYEKGGDGKEYPNVNPMHVSELTDEQRAEYLLPRPEAQSPAPDSPTEDDIPI